MYKTLHHHDGDFLKWKEEKKEDTQQKHCKVWVFGARFSIHIKKYCVKNCFTRFMLKVTYHDIIYNTKKFGRKKVPNNRESLK